MLSRGGGVGTLWVPPTTPSLVFSTHARPLSLIGQLGAGWAKPVDTAAQDAGMGQVLPKPIWRICAALVAGGSALLPRLLHTGKEYINKRVKVLLSSFLYRNIYTRGGQRFFLSSFWLQLPFSPSDCMHRLYTVQHLVQKEKKYYE
jgi:hypothetical protein